ncbi:lipid IV(A) 3-deoxy-D-manno-octulosonic acid transferase [Jiella sp. MQZ9-1]|uniref:3-deoxy-D-manno-octulosonic acid transferase n=2 Tax=Jiella flava TaxID=2816857 RepID=A0A939FYT2_9HYPH|nr:lipid IV(A) 3-deoxy-D-manno-octulosonic acid transferase [Jiella flava]MBO0664065.1 lipid IV(A) 3-deoxy-D-manno-octulosonic acid transferase [Jiella flava]MCD2472637.1 lipid IV(A) 3-deoxy-D-manno-octulosonic acid transferase [Jiella flava]
MTKAAFAAYAFAGTLAYPFLRPYVGWRVSKGKEDKRRQRERYGIASKPRPKAGPLIWLHAASVGESLAVAPLVRAMACDGLQIVMTTGTITSANLVEERLADCVIHQYVPLDVGPAVGRFLDHWRPDLAIVAESEIWPLTIHELARRRIPQILVNARMSDRSFQRWKARPRIAEVLFEKFAHVIAQSDVDAERFRLLGAHAVSLAGNLKADAAPLSADSAALEELSGAVGARPRFAAISTHPGEEDLVAETHLALRLRHEGLLTILVPRHADRGAAIAKMLADKGLTVTRRSEGVLPDAATDVYLGDTMGELGLYLRLSEIAFIGKSITGQGGQNPIEAAMLATGILTGRYVQNFRDTYQRLLRAGGARIVRDADELTVQVDTLLVDPIQRMAMARAALRAIDDMRGALDRTLAALDPFLHPLRLSVSLERQGRVGSVR